MSSNSSLNIKLFNSISLWLEVPCDETETLPEAELLSGFSNFLKEVPNVVYEKAKDNSTLLHSAAYFQSPELCQLLIEANPNLVRIVNNVGDLPFHVACRSVNVETAKYLFHLYPESINIPNGVGEFPLHAFCQLRGFFKNDDIQATIELVQFLLRHDRGGVSKPSQYDRGGWIPLHYACDYSPWWLRLVVTKRVFDAYPEAICIRNDDGETPLDYARNHNIADVVAFLERQIRWERRAREDRTPDSKGNLPIHRRQYGVCGSNSVLIGSQSGRHTEVLVEQK
eukprot:scaffold14277_cov69-Cyclotella_meneghiniana.AAC.2